jgi:hypothetical protein
MDLFLELVNKTKATVDRKGEAFIACPNCGHASSPRDVHFSFSVRGGYCFSCGYRCSLVGLARKLGQPTTVLPSNLPIERPRKAVSWLRDVEHLIEEFVSHRASWGLWRAYKPVSRENFERMRLGVGVLPASRCHHERLIVPIYDGTMCVGLRGRSITCDCAKWLAPGGTSIDLYPLYNEQALTPGCVAWIVENPIDALLVGQFTPYVGVATYSVSYWQERWSQALQRASQVIVAFDNDVPGNGGRRQEWLASHPGVRTPPVSAGPRLTNRLLSAGLRAVLFDWGNRPQKDIGALLSA